MSSIQKLNSAQQAAVEHTDGPLLIVAGAGTGKTTVITQKIAYLIERGLAKPEEILAVTFTEKAATEMLARVDEFVNIGYTEMQISTFHAFCQRLLEEYGLDIGLPNQFKLLTPIDAWMLVRRHLDKFNLDYYRPLGNPARHIHELLRHFSKCKDELITPREYLNYAEEEKADSGSMEQLDNEKIRLTEVANAYHTYNQLLLDNNSLDFGDLIFYAIKLLQERPNALQALQKRFKFILVDEFQDVNWAQYQLVSVIARNASDPSLKLGTGSAIPMKRGIASLPTVARNDIQLTVVGDDDQSIYAFRGASVSNILRFKDDYPDAKEIVLTENYRSGQEILDLAYKSIQNNNPDRLEVKLKIDKHLKAKNEEYGIENIEYRYCVNLDDEVRYLVEKIREICDNKSVVLSDIAILVRANAHAEPFVNALEKVGIPYEYLASSGLFRQSVVLDCYNFLKIIDSYHESTAVYRLLRLPFLNFSDADLQQLTYLAGKKAISYYQALKRAPEFGLSEEGMKICEKLLSLINEGARRGRSEKPTRILYDFLEQSGYLSYLAHEETMGQRTIIRQIHFLRQFLDLVSEFENNIPDAHPASFLEHFNYILEAGDEGAIEPIDSADEAVKIMTIHSAKGLEFRYVFVVNLVEERFPTRRRGEGIEIPLVLIKEHLPEGDYHLQEERRLFYVAITRAKEKLFLTSAENYSGARKKKISRFLDELGFKSFLEEGAPKGRKVLPLEVNANIGNTPRPARAGHPSQEGNFSYSQINSYQRCPYQYKLAHILHLPTKGNASFSFGQTMHSTLQKFYERVRELNSVKQSALFSPPPEKGERGGILAGIKVPTLDELLNLYEKSWIDDWYESKRQQEDYYKKGKEILKIFYASQEGDWTIPAILESGFKIKVGNHILNGRIDRVDKLADGRLEIIDYKTGRAKEKVAGDDKDQLLIYQIAAETLPEYKNLGEVGRLTFYYLNDNLKTSFVGKREELEKLREKILGVIGKIHTGDFTAAPSQHTCAHCDFRDICQFRKL